MSAKADQIEAMREAILAEGKKLGLEDGGAFAAAQMAFTREWFRHQHCPCSQHSREAVERFIAVIEAGMDCYGPPPEVFLHEVAHADSN